MNRRANEESGEHAYPSMMGGVKRFPGVLIGVGASVALHVGVAGVAARYGIDQGDPARNRARDAREFTLVFEPDAATPPDQTTPPVPENPPKAVAVVPETPPSAPPLPKPAEREEDLRLGLEKSKLASKNWLGFEDPTEHKAPKSQVTQPALDPNPSAPGNPGAPGMAQAAASPAEATQATPATPAQPPAEPAASAPAVAEVFPDPAAKAAQNAARDSSTKDTGTDALARAGVDDPKAMSQREQPDGRVIPERPDTPKSELKLDVPKIEPIPDLTPTTPAPGAMPAPNKPETSGEPSGQSPPMPGENVPSEPKPEGPKREGDTVPIDKAIDTSRDPLPERPGEVTIASSTFVGPPLPSTSDDMELPGATAPASSAGAPPVPATSPAERRAGALTFVPPSLAASRRLLPAPESLSKVTTMTGSGTSAPATPTPPVSAQPSKPTPRSAATSASPATPASAGESGSNGDGGVRDANPSAKESEATSTEDEVEIMPGRPAAGQGLDITTRRPNFSRLTRTIAWPSNPLLKVTFGRSGDVIKVVLVESSGDRSVDEPVINAVYQWVARGERLERLNENDPDAGLTINVRIILR